MRAIALAPLLFGLTSAWAPAWADDLAFRSPSGNIQCLLSDTADQPAAECRLTEGTDSFTAPPEGCEGDWGKRLNVTATGPGRRSCWSDASFETRLDDTPPLTLPYGFGLSVGALHCRSGRAGVTCVNATGGCFSVRRAAQTVF